MRAVKFSATLRKFSVKAPEDGGNAEISVFVSMAESNRKALAALCENPDEAAGAMETVKKTPSKLEIPAGREICALTAVNGSKQHQPDHVVFARVVLDTRGGECQTRIDYDESKTADGVAFYGKAIGCTLEFSVSPKQTTIDDEIEAKKAESKGDKKEPEE